MTCFDRSISFSIALTSVVLNTCAISAQETDGTSTPEQDSSSPTEQEMAPPENNDSEEGLSPGGKAGIAIAVIILTAILVMLLWIKCRGTSDDTDIKRVDTREAEDPMCGTDIGSHNSHCIDVRRCASSSCTECGTKVDSPVKFLAAHESASKDTEDTEEIMENAEPNEGLEEVDIDDDLEAAASGP